MTEQHLKTIEQRLLWLSHWMIHNANNIRPKVDGIKVGGHQASSASMVSIMTALWFGHIGGDDKVAVKPHASPVYHAIKYLTGELDRSYLTRLREFGGLQAYPSRTKDPDVADFSTGSVGLGAVAPLFAAMVRRYVEAQFGPQRGDGRVHGCGPPIAEQRVVEGAHVEGVAVDAVEAAVPAPVGEVRDRLRDLGAVEHVVALAADVLDLAVEDVLTVLLAAGDVEVVDVLPLAAHAAVRDAVAQRRLGRNGSFRSGGGGRQGVGQHLLRRFGGQARSKGARATRKLGRKGSQTAL